MKDFLTLSTGTNGPAPQRVAPISGTSPRQSRVRQTLAGLNQAYRALSMTQKGGWQTVSNTLNTSQNRTGKHKLHPANAFVTLNSARLACGQSVLSDAPTDLAAPPVMPNTTITASGPAATQGNLTTAPFTLNVVTATSYYHTTQILAAPPAPAGKNTFPDADFKTIGFVQGFGGNTDIAAQYQATYGIPEPGSQIALKLIATSPAGIRLAPLVLTGIVTAAAAQANPLHIG